MKNIIIAIAISAICLSGCATVGKEVPQSSVNQIEKGKTTKSEIIKIFGQPLTTYFDASGRLVFTYMSSKVSPTAWNFIPLVNIVHSEMKTKNQFLCIVFSKNEIVENYSFTNSDTPIKYGIVP